MTSMRLSAGDLRILHQATPRGVPLVRALRVAFDMAGGPDAVRAALDEADRGPMAAARVSRLRLASHRSVVVSPDEQVALADAAADWTRLLERIGLRSFDPVGRRLHLRGNATSQGLRPRVRRTGVGP